jgi:hypothetical protein
VSAAAGAGMKWCLVYWSFTDTGAFSDCSAGEPCGGALQPRAASRLCQHAHLYGGALVAVVKQHERVVHVVQVFGLLGFCTCGGWWCGSRV